MENTRYKFRAWDTQTETMRDVLVIDWVNELIDLSGGIIERRPHEVILMQYTRLVDKRGVEIYEGDVVSMVVFEDKAEYLGDVVFENGCFCLNISLDGTKYKVPALEWKETETIITVIDNVYQNKDLI